MPSTKSEQIRAGVIAFIQSLLPVLVLAGVVSLDDKAQAGIMLAVTNAVTLFFLFLPNKVEPPAGG